MSMAGQKVTDFIKLPHTWNGLTFDQAGTRLLVSGGASGDPCSVHGTVRSLDGSPVAGATLDIWQSDDTGNYDVQYPDLDAPQGRGRSVNL